MGLKQRSCAAALVRGLVVAALALLIAGCGGRSWPTVKPQVAAANPAAAPVRTIDILPMDMAVWTYRENGRVDPNGLREQVDALTAGAVRASLAQQGYLISADIDWNGNFVDNDGTVANAMRAEEVAYTNAYMAGYGRAVAQAQQGLLVPYLPARLGDVTGADATLYVGGWSYVGEDKKDGTGTKIAKGVAIGILAVAVIGILVLTAKKGGGGGSGLGKVVGGAGKLATGTARVAGRAGGVFLRGSAKVASQLARGVANGFDAMGRGHTHISIDLGGRGSYVPPDYAAERDLPRRGRSSMYLEMTLIDNRTGMPLWHARERFPANGTNVEQVHEAVRRMLTTLPAAY